jgi:hypothetical protein
MLVTMIPQLDLDRALARWKAKKTGEPIPASLTGSPPAAYAPILSARAQARPSIKQVEVALEVDEPEADAGAYAEVEVEAQAVVEARAHAEVEVEAHVDLEVNPHAEATETPPLEVTPMAVVVEEVIAEVPAGYADAATFEAPEPSFDAPVTFAAPAADDLAVAPVTFAAPPPGAPAPITFDSSPEAPERTVVADVADVVSFEVVSTEERTVPADELGDGAATERRRR